VPAPWNISQALIAPAEIFRDPAPIFAAGACSPPARHDPDERRGGRAPMRTDLARARVESLIPHVDHPGER
jgi:hypothetical protein